MPEVIANMLTATSAPRTRAGTSSAMYIGEMKEARPIPSPLTTLPAINHATVGAKAVPMALAAKIMPAQMSGLRRPKRFVRTPPAVAPTMAPIKTMLTTISSMVAERENWFWTNRMAPEITPVSYPKSSPPRDAMPVATYARGFTSDFAFGVIRPHPFSIRMCSPRSPARDETKMCFVWRALRSHGVLRFLGLHRRWDEFSSIWILQWPAHGCACTR